MQRQPACSLYSTLLHKCISCTCLASRPIVVEHQTQHPPACLSLPPSLVPSAPASQDYPYFPGERGTVSPHLSLSVLFTSATTHRGERAWFAVTYTTNTFAASSHTYTEGEGGGGSCPRPSGLGFRSVRSVVSEGCRSNSDHLRWLILGLDAAVLVSRGQGGSYAL